ncbi:MAG: Ku protein [Thermoanaerobacteraceae bacterium]|nr:Ku protein [Thermoanaerobacteraceae bacterium]
MRTMWKGAISFGLVNIPIKMYTATEIKSIRFNYLHAECKTPIKYEKVCPACGREVANDEIVRGFEYEKGKYVVLMDEDLEHLPLNTLKTIDILDFVDLEEIDPIYFIKSYFLVPENFGQKAYKLLYRALAETGKIAVAKVFLRSKESLAALRIYENVILLHTMFFPNEIRAAGELPDLENVELHDNEIKMAISLVKNLSASFEPEKYTSEYRQALMELIQAKIDREEISIPERTEVPKVVDLMEALKKSVEAARQENQAKGITQKKVAKKKKTKRKRATS